MLWTACIVHGPKTPVIAVVQGARHSEKLIGVVPALSPLARGSPPTMDEMIAMERRKVAYSKIFSLDLAPATPSYRFNLMHQTDASLDAALSNGEP